MTKQFFVALTALFAIARVTFAASLEAEIIETLAAEKDDLSVVMLEAVSQPSGALEIEDVDQGTLDDVFMRDFNPKLIAEFFSKNTTSAQGSLRLSFGCTKLDNVNASCVLTQSSNAVKPANSTTLIFDIETPHDDWPRINEIRLGYAKADQITSASDPN